MKTTLDERELLELRKVLCALLDGMVAAGNIAQGNDSNREFSRQWMSEIRTARKSLDWLICEGGFRLPEISGDAA